MSFWVAAMVAAGFPVVFPQSRAVMRLVANASSEEATLRLRAEVPWRAKCQLFCLGGEKQEGTKYG